VGALRETTSTPLDPPRLQVAKTVLETIAPRLFRDVEGQTRGGGVSAGSAGLLIAVNPLNEFLGSSSAGLTKNLAALTLRRLESERHPVGLASGLAGITFALQSVCDELPKLLETVESLKTLVSSTIKNSWISVRGPWSRYDWVSGLAGICGIGTFAESRTLNHLADAWNARSTQVIFTEAVDMPESMRNAYPGGGINTGLAHGVAGLIAAFSFSLTMEPDQPKVRHALKSLCRWLRSTMIVDRAGVRGWPSIASVDQGVIVYGGSWCYGASGIALVLSQAAEILEDDVMIEEAESIMRDVYIFLRKSDGGSTPMLCHGTAGTAMVALKFFSRSAASEHRDGLRMLFDRIMASFSNDFPICFRFDDRPGVDMNRIHFLEGATGTALALAAIVDGHLPRWSRLLGIDDGLSCISGRP